MKWIKNLLFLKEEKRDVVGLYKLREPKEIKQPAVQPDKFDKKNIKISDLIRGMD